MWEKGTRVRITKSNRPKAKAGTMGTIVVIGDDVTDSFLVEFDELMGGHNGRSYYEGKFGHCWFFNNTILSETTTDSGITIKQAGKRKNNYY